MLRFPGSRSKVPLRGENVNLSRGVTILKDAPEFMRALSSQQPRFLNNLCASVCLSVCLSVRAGGANLCRKLASASYANFDTLLKGVPKRVPKITSLNPLQAYFPGPPKNRTFLKKLRKKICSTNDLLAPKAPCLRHIPPKAKFFLSRFPPENFGRTCPAGPL